MLALERPLLTVPDVAARLKVTDEGVRRLLRSGQLVGMRLGGDRNGWRITEEDLARFIEERKNVRG